MPRRRRRIPAQRSPNRAEVLDRVLDKGLVVKAGARFPLLGLNLLGLDAHVIMASMDAYRKRVGLPGSALPAAEAALPAERRVSATPAGALPPAPAAAAVRARPKTCPRCRRNGQRQELLTVSLGTSTETRASLRCPSCGWQRTYYAA